jgi:hypothetical protein
VRWAGRDADGDALTYGLFYAADGARYSSVAIDLEGVAYSFDAAPGDQTRSGHERVRVVASDGFNTGEASFPLE